MSRTRIGPHATRCCRKRSRCAGTARPWRSNGGACRPAARCRPTTPSTEPTGTVHLSELFENGKDTLFLYNFMFIPGEQGLPLEGACPSCTSIIDAVDGEAPHIVQRVNLAVVAKAPLEQFQEHARTRGWRNVRLLSSASTTYNADYNGEGERGQNPIATVFVRRDGAIRHFWSSELFDAPTEPGLHPRHVDFMWPVWSVFDCTPEGRGTDWFPELAYH